MLKSYGNLVKLIQVRKELRQVIENSNGHDVIAINALSLIENDISNLKKKLVDYAPHQGSGMSHKILDKSLDKASDNLFPNILKHMGIM